MTVKQGAEGDEEVPFEIVRNDIVNVSADAIVNTSLCEPVIGHGCDVAINEKAGPLLLEARKRIGRIETGCSAITPAFDLDARYVIHTAEPVWHGGLAGEKKKLRSCYESALSLAKEYGCESVAFPLLSAGTGGFPKSVALETAVGAISRFLLENDMRICLVVFSREAFFLSEKLFKKVSSFIDEKYISERRRSEYGAGFTDPGDFAIAHREKAEAGPSLPEAEVYAASPVPARTVSAARRNKALSMARDEKDDLLRLLKNTDEGFSATLLKLIDLSGKKDSQIYKKANIDRKLFSKIRSNPDYKPSKPTAIAFAMALELSLPETKELIARAGYALSHSSKADIIVEYFITNKKYDVIELNEVLFAFDQPLIGG